MMAQLLMKTKYNDGSSHVIDAGIKMDTKIGDTIMWRSLYSNNDTKRRDAIGSGMFLF